MTKTVDLLVVGGGLNGTAIARDAAGRGVSVYLAEAVDWGAGISSGTAKAGSRVLDAFRKEQFNRIPPMLEDLEKLGKSSPHLCSPMRVLFPHRKGQGTGGSLRGALRNLFHSGGPDGSENFPAPSRIEKSKWAKEFPFLRTSGLTGLDCAYEYCLDDTRLAVENAINARARGADIGNNRHVRKIESTGEGFLAEIMTPDGQAKVEARFVVNATGARSRALAKAVKGIDISGSVPDCEIVRLGQILLPMTEPEIHDGFIFFRPDGGIATLVPWLNGKGLLMTTELGKADGETAIGTCGSADLAFMLDILNCNLKSEKPGRNFVADDCLWNRAVPAPRLAGEEGVVMDLVTQGDAGIVTVIGGAVEGHMTLAEQVIASLKLAGLEAGDPWTADTHNHGGGMTLDELADLARNGSERVAEDVRWRWVQTYGARTRNLYEMVEAVKFLSREVAPGVPEAELLYAVEVEDANHAEDFLFRRTRLGLTLDPDGLSAIEEWFGRVEEKAREMLQAN